MRLIIWGTGKFGEWANMLFESYDIIAYVDSDSNKIGSTFHGKKVWSKDLLLKNYKDEIIVITPRGYEDEIGKWLIENDINSFFAFEKEVWGLHAFLKQVDRTLLEKDLSNADGWSLYPQTLLSLFLREWIQSKGLTADITDEIEELKGQNVIITSVLKPDDIQAIQTVSASCLDYSNISSREDLFFDESLSQFKDIHKGERCFIIATGPSLRMQDLDKLYQNKEVCFSVNGIVNAFDMTRWRPTYYCIADHLGLNLWMDEILEMDAEKKFVSDLGWNSELFDDRAEFCKWHLNSTSKKGCQPNFNSDITKGVWWARTVVCDICIPMAIYMGFKEIYLLGTDCSFNDDPRKQHFVSNYNKGKESKAQRLEVEEIIMSYHSAKSYADAHGIKIYNATRGGNLEVFERVEFDSLF